MKKFYRNYIANFEGLSKEIWLLSLVTFINRAGAMVIPFLSLYLVTDKGFTKPEVGIIMTCFGIGSFAGTWIGGKLTDSIGFYKVITGSLFLGGVGFFLLQYIDTFYGFCIGIFSLILVADAYRPAIFVASDVYSKEGNKTRSIALIRLAINLGFSIGPVIGGLIIAHISYTSLFWIDGITCAAAAILLFILLKPKKATIDEPVIIIKKEGLPPYRNTYFVLFFIIMVLTSITFVQYFSVMPLYYSEDHFLNEDTIGWLMFLNGAMIVIFEMPLVAWLERIKISKTMATFWGGIFIMLSFLVVNLTSWSGVLVVGMLLMTIGEMVGSPFSSALALEMAPKGRKGNYMGLYSMSFSISHMVGHNGGMNLAESFGYDITWYAMAAVLIIVSILTLWLYRLLKKSPKFSTL
ncbi:MFS transporter [Patiriisocius marinistellae]|uniref:MFS transporter n=1 Tax=Patiriisocius marinistellae TaxID=2494560 RepID=A0A5J4FZV7_9FLAO|nr:MFS transporter [Patiriisocius marinistellae]GEQ85749.1 MFS transporter [Patiriisocius marinistellae]